MKDNEDDKANQHEKFRAEIHKYTNDGYYVITQSDSTVQLRKPKKFSWFWAVMWTLFTLGLGIFVYLVYFGLVKKDTFKYLSIGDSTKKNFDSGIVENI